MLGTHIVGTWEMMVSLFLSFFLPRLTQHGPGFDTITTAISWSLMYLVTKPEIQRKIQKELGTWGPPTLWPAQAWRPRLFVQSTNTCHVPTVCSSGHTVVPALAWKMWEVSGVCGL